MGRPQENPLPPPSDPTSPPPPPPQGHPDPPPSDQMSFQPPSPHHSLPPPIDQPSFQAPPPQGYPLPPSSDQTAFQPPSQGYPVPPSSDQTAFQPPPHQGYPVPPSSDQTAFQPPPQGYPVPQSTDQTPFQPPPESYPNRHDNPLSSFPPPLATRSYVQPPSQPSQCYPPQQPTAAYPPQAQPAAAYPSQQPAVGNGTCYVNPQNCNYTPTATPNWYQPAATMSMIPQGWSTGLLDCFDDPENAIMTFCFPCVTFGQIAEIIDNGQTSCSTSALIYSLITAFIGIPCIMSCSYRTKLRSRYNLVETPAPDWVIHFFCEYCALCQEYRELKKRGMDPALGWQGNVLRHQQMANYSMMTPPTNQRMVG